MLFYRTSGLVHPCRAYALHTIDPASGLLLPRFIRLAPPPMLRRTCPGFNFLAVVTYSSLLVVWDQQARQRKRWKLGDMTSWTAAPITTSLTGGGHGRVAVVSESSL